MPEDKKELNKIFFERLAARQDGPMAPPELDDLAKVIIRKGLSPILANATKSLRVLSDRGFERAMSYHTEFTNCLREASRKRREALALMDRRPAIADEVTQIIRDGYFEYVGIDDQEIMFRTRGDVICHHRNEAAGVFWRVNFGRFLVCLKPADTSVCIRPYQRNVKVSGFIHPHADSDGEICWGDAAPAASRHLVDFKFAPLFRILQGVLEQYNDDAPYVSLSDFQAKQPESAPPEAGKPPALCPDCEERLSHCECSRCEYCESAVCECPLCPDEDCGRIRPECSVILCRTCNHHQNHCACVQARPQYLYTTTGTAPTFRVLPGEVDEIAF